MCNVPLESVKSSVARSAAAALMTPRAIAGMALRCVVFIFMSGRCSRVRSTPERHVSWFVYICSHDGATYSLFHCYDNIWVDRNVHNQNDILYVCTYNFGCTQNNSIATEQFMTSYICSQQWTRRLERSRQQTKNNNKYYAHFVSNTSFCTDPIAHCGTSYNHECIIHTYWGMHVWCAQYAHDYSPIARI